MSMKNKQMVDALRSVLAEAGIDRSEIRHGGKHPRLYWERDGVEEFTVFSMSPSDSRAIENAQRDLRKKLGIERQTNKNPANRERRDVRKVEPVEVPTVTPGKDWAASLKDHDLYEGEPT